MTARKFGGRQTLTGRGEAVGETVQQEPRWVGGIEPPSELITDNMVAIYERECAEQPDRLAELCRAYSEDESILKEIAALRKLSLSPGPILFAGMGASYCSAAAGSLLLQSCGRSSFLVDAGEWLHYSDKVWDQVAATILFTTSGESAELVQLCRRDTGKPIVLLCNNSASTCWAATQHRLPILAGPEYGNATKSYTNATAAAIALACEIVERPWRQDAEQVLETFSGDLQHAFRMRGELESFCRDAKNIEVIGRGPSYSGAIMGALCIREMSGKRAAPHTGAGFRHGPLLDVDDSHVAIILALGREADLGVRLARDCNARGGRVILVATEEYQRSKNLFPVKIHSVPEPWEAITSVIVSQALTLGLVEQFGTKLPPRFQYGAMVE